jgi:hypothetical protein
MAQTTLDDEVLAKVRNAVGTYLLLEETYDFYGEEVPDRAVARIKELETSIRTDLEAVLDMTSMMSPDTVAQDIKKMGEALGGQKAVPFLFLAKALVKVANNEKIARHV